MHSRYWTKYEYKWSFIFTLVFLLWAVLEVEFGWHTQEEFSKHIYFTFLFIFPAFLTYSLFFYDKRSKRFKRRFKFKHAFKSGLVLTILITLFNIPTQWLVHKVVTPFYLENLRFYLADTVHLDPEIIKEVTFENSLWFFPLVIFILGFFTTLLYAVFLRKH